MIHFAPFAGAAILCMRGTMIAVPQRMAQERPVRDGLCWAYCNAIAEKEQTCFIADMQPNQTLRGH